MKKIPSIFIRDWNGDRSLVTRIGADEARWVFDGEGVATRKFDGSAVLIKNGELLCRFDAKKGKTPPANFVPCQEAPDPETSHWPGWVPAGNNPQYQWQRLAFKNYQSILYTEPHVPLNDATYEACGPHFQGNPEGLTEDVLIPHGNQIYIEAPRTFMELKEFLTPLDIEGLVWHHPDGRMAKIKKSDFGLPRKVAVNA